MNILRLATAVIWLTLISPVQAKEPKVPPGLDPGGVAVALLGGGVDYTRPTIAKRLARDGEGDLIGWDFTDNDIRPFTSAGSSTDDAERLINLSQNIRLVIIKEPAGNAAAIGHMAAFTIRTPARILFWPDGNPGRPDWQILFQAAARFKDRLFIVPAPAKVPPEYAKIENIAFSHISWAGNARANAFHLVSKAAALLAENPSLSSIQLRKAISP